jgi:photosystem II stability/assembly factor-like uncharacterized protein
MKKPYFFLVALIIMNAATAQWYTHYSGTTQNLNSVYFPEANLGYAVGNNGTILKTITGGVTWDSMPSGTTVPLNSVYFTDAITGYAVSWGTILKTINGGTNWSETPVQAEVCLNSVFFPDANTGYIVGTYNDPFLMYISGYILKTTDGGITWTQLPFEPMQHSLLSVYFTDVNIGYAVGGTNGGWGPSPAYIIKTIDGGATWTESSIMPNVVLLSVCFPDDNTGYAAGNDIFDTNGIIYKTIDAGATWDTLLTTVALNSIYFTDINTGYAVGDYGIILKTTDGGINWFNQTNVITSSHLYSVYFPNIDTGYISGFYGTLLTTTNAGGPTVGVNDHLPFSTSLKIYPNPASNKISIETSAEGLLSIQNVNGREILNKLLTKAYYQIDISSFASGVYFLKLTNEKSVQVGKFIKE